MQLGNNMPKELSSFLQNSQLLSVAENIMKDLDITPENVDKNMQMTDIMSLAGK